MMKRLLLGLLCSSLLFLYGCSTPGEAPRIAATTLPVYEFCTALCENTPLTVGRLISEPVSCLHDYSLNVNQVRQAEAAETIVISGAGLEEFMEDILEGSAIIDASAGIPLLEGEHHSEEAHTHSHEDEHAHGHEDDPHIWLSPENAGIMAENICAGLTKEYPAYKDAFEDNLKQLTRKLEELGRYGKDELAELSCRELITFHDGFAYFADCFDLTILDAVEEESGSEASAKELIALIEILREHDLPAVFVETNGSPSAASVIAAETGANIFSLDMAMAGDSYFEAMYHNIDTIKEALG